MLAGLSFAGAASAQTSPQQPTGVEGTPGTYWVSGKIKLSWDAPTDGVSHLPNTEYRVWLSDGTGSWSTWSTFPSAPEESGGKVTAITRELDGTRDRGRLWDLEVRHCNAATPKICSGTGAGTFIVTATPAPRVFNVGAVRVHNTTTEVKLLFQRSPNPETGNNGFDESYYEVGYTTDLSATAPESASLHKISVASNRSLQDHVFTLAPRTRYKLFIRSVVEGNVPGFGHRREYESPWKTVTLNESPKKPGHLQGTPADNYTNVIDLDWIDTGNSGEDLSKAQYRLKFHDLTQWSNWTLFWGTPSTSDGRVRARTGGIQYTNGQGSVFDVQVRNCKSDGTTCGPAAQIHTGTRPPKVFSVGAEATASGSNNYDIKITFDPRPSPSNPAAGFWQSFYEFGWSTNTRAQYPDDSTKIWGHRIDGGTPENRDKRDHTFSGVARASAYKLFIRTYLQETSGGNAVIWRSPWQAATVSTRTTLPAPTIRPYGAERVHVTTEITHIEGLDEDALQFDIQWRRQGSGGNWILQTIPADDSRVKTRWAASPTETFWYWDVKFGNVPTLYPNANWEYRVRFVHKGGGSGGNDLNGSWSSIKSFRTRPVGVNGVALEDQLGAEITWSDPFAGIDGTAPTLRIERAESGGNSWDKVGEDLAKDATSRIDTSEGLVAYQGHNYRLVLTDNSHALGSTGAIFMNEGNPNAPPNLAAQEVYRDPTQVRITWDNSNRNPDLYAMQYQGDGVGDNLITTGCSDGKGSEDCSNVTSPIFLSDLDSSKIYTIDVIAVWNNDDGTTTTKTSAIDYSPSEAPTTPSVSAEGSVLHRRGLKVIPSWPENPGHQTFEIYYRKKGDTNWLQSQDNDGNPVNPIPDLLGNTEYEVYTVEGFPAVDDPNNPGEILWPKITRESEVGTGTPWHPHPEFTVHSGDESLQVTIEDPSGYPPSLKPSYYIGITRDFGNLPDLDWEVASPFGIRSLPNGALVQNGVTYKVAVFAKYADYDLEDDPNKIPFANGFVKVGPSELGSYFKEQTPADGGPQFGMSEPLNVVADGTGANLVVMSWNAPGSGGGGGGASFLASMMRGSTQSGGRSSGQITYEVTYKPESADWEAGGTQQTPDTSTTISNLNPGQTYDFRVRALSTDSSGAWSETATATTDEGESTRPESLESPTTATTAAQTLDLAFSAPADSSDWVAANSQYRVLGQVNGASWSDWTTVQGATVSGGTISGTTQADLAIGQLYDVAVRWCGETPSDETCSAASDTAVGATPASAPTAALAVADPNSATQMWLSWEIADVGDGQNPHATYELGYSTDTAAEEPATRVDAADVPAFGATGAVLEGLAADTEYRLYVRSVIVQQGETLFASPWAWDTDTTQAPDSPSLVLGEAPADPSYQAGTAIEALALPEATGGTGDIGHALQPASWNGLSFDAASRTLSGTPTAAGQQTYTYTATDAAGTSAELEFTATVAADAVPTYEGIDSPALEFTEGEAIDPVTLPAATGGDGALTYTVSPTLADGLAFDAASRTLSGTPETEADSATWTLAATDAGNDTAELTFTIAVAPPPATRPENLDVVTSAQTAWKALDVAFDAPPTGSAWVAAKSQIRVLGMKPGAKRTGWRPFASVTVEDGRAQASTASWMAIGRVYEVEVRWCEANGRTCSEASDMVYGASPASVPTDAGTAVTEPVSETALLLHWSISPIGGKKNLQAAYEIGYSTQTDAETPETLLADVPAFGTKEAEIDGFESGTAYRLYVRSVIDWQGTRHFASDWASATATTPAGAESLARQQLQGELAKHARALLEDASTVIGQRFTAGSGSGGDALTALASVFGGAGGSACPRQVALGDCLPQPGIGQPGIGQPGEPWDPERDYQPPMTTQGQGLGTLLQRLQTQNFSLSLNRTLLGETDDAPQPVQLALWGSGGTAFQGGQGQRFVGLDARLGTQWLTGVAVAQGGSAFQPVGGATGGELGSALTTVYPYLRGQLSDTLAVWSLAGWGWGDLTSRWQDPYRPGQTVTLDGALGLNLGLAGVEQTVYAGDGLSVAVVGDYGWSQLAVSGLAGGSLGAVVHRSRLGVTSDYASSDGALRGTLRLSGRLDGGAGERAQGAEMTGSLHYGLGRWTGGVTGHWYGATQALAGVATQGLQLVLERRAATDGTGWTGRLAPGWGTAAGLGAGPGAGTPLLATVGGVGSVAGAPTLRVDGQVAWGLRLGDEQGLLVRPFANVGMAAAGQQMRAGVQPEGPVQLNLTVEHLRRPTAPATMGVLLQVDTTF